MFRTIINLVVFCIPVGLQATQSPLKGTSHLKVDFEQESFRKLRKTWHKRAGVAYFSAPNLFKFEFKDSDGKVESYYFNGMRLSVYSEKDKEVRHYESQSAHNRKLSQVAEMVLDYEKLKADYRELPSKSKPEEPIIRLELKEPGKRTVDQIEILLDSKTNIIKKVHLFEKRSNQTIYKFKNPDKEPLDKAVFTFQNPGGIKETLISF